MLSPCVGNERRRAALLLASALCWRGAVKRAVDAEFVVIIPECLELAREVDRVPEELAIEILAADGADQPFDERMRSRLIGYGLDLIDFEDVGEPAVKAKEWVVIGTEVFWSGLTSNSLIEHPLWPAIIDDVGCRYTAPAIIS
jgi:hypothetical protein